MRLRFVRVVLLGLLGLLFAAGSATADKARAKDHFKKGQVKYTLEKWDEAIAEFEAGYEEEPDAVFLYNIAQAHRLAGRPKVALDFYRKFLNKRPDAPNPAEIEEQIAALEKMSKTGEPMPPGAKTGGTTATKPTESKPVATKPAEARPVETKPADSKPAETPSSKPAETKPVTTLAASTTPSGSTSQPPLNMTEQPAATKPDEIPPGARAPTPDEQPPAATKKKTWPIWVGVAAGVLVAGGAATAAILATRSNGTLLPPVDAR